MTTVYLHIGLPKTGTSTVQGAIQKLRPLLGERGFWTPQGIMAHHRFAVGALEPDDLRLKTAHYQRVLASGKDAVFTEFEQAVRDGNNILISSEYLNDCGGKAAARLLARMGVKPAAARIVVCLRRQDRFIESSYNQEVKRMGRTRRLAWTREKTAPWDWQRKLSEWADEFGDDAIRVLVYERLAQQAPGALFAQAILGACDLAFDHSVFESIAGEVEDFSNASLPAELVEFKRVANTVTRIGEIDWLVQMAMAAGVGNARYRMDKALAREIIDYYRPSNDEVARRFLKEPGPLFDDALEDPDADAQPRLHPKIMSQLIALLAAEIGTLRAEARLKQRRKAQARQST